MIHITQLIYIFEGQERTFDEFEDIAIPLIGEYNGKLLFRLRPTDSCYIGTPHERPYEIHLVEFPTLQDYESFKRDERRKKHLHLKEQSVRAAVLLERVF
jgi:hypothetical protein